VETLPVGRKTSSMAGLRSRPAGCGSLRSRPAGCGSPVYPQCGGRARKYSALAIDILVELTKDSHTDSTRFSAARSFFAVNDFATQANFKTSATLAWSTPNGVVRHGKIGCSCQRWVMDVISSLREILPVFTRHQTYRCNAANSGPRTNIALHSITSSARASSSGGTSIPIVFAALALMTSSNLVGC
jgi:hypothetical protein